jgi:hypothetical protein
VSVVAVGAAALGVGVASAFTDTASSPFATEIDNIANAGIATGFPDDTYRPRDAVNRQQMAAFFNRGGGRVGQSDNQSGATVVNSGTALPANVVSGQMAAGATGAGTNGYVLWMLNANVTPTNVTTDCPCRVRLEIVTTPACSETTMPETVTVDASASSTFPQALSMNQVCSIAGDSIQTATVRVAFFSDDGGTNPSVRIDAQLTGLYVPFGPAGTNAP